MLPPDQGDPGWPDPPAHGAITYEAGQYDPNAQPPPDPAVCPAGLRWSDPRGRFDCIGAICLPYPPQSVSIEGQQVETTIVVTWDPVQVLWGQGATLAALHPSQGHFGDNLCKKFTALHPGRWRVKAKVDVIANGQSITGYPRFYHVEAAVVGGPLRIEDKYKADEAVFTLHPVSWKVDPEGKKPPQLEKQEYPWYGTDFDYDPFLYRGGGFGRWCRPGMQPANVFEAKPLWLQPPGTKVAFSVTEPGCLLNRNDAELLPGPSRLGTRGLPCNAQGVGPYAYIGSCGGAGQRFTLTAQYMWDSDTSAIINQPFAPLATDSSNKYWDKNSPELTENGKEYNTFLVHRPNEAKQWPPGDPNSSAYQNNPDISIWPTPAGFSGGILLYQLKDNEGKGMPGVWVQERFQYPEQVPEGVRTNASGNKWVTQRYAIFSAQREWRHGPLVLPINHRLTTTWSKEIGVFGPDYLFLPNDLVPDPPAQFVLQGHEYWAGTDKATYDLVPETGRYFGIFVGRTRIVIEKGKHVRQPDIER